MQRKFCETKFKKDLEIKIQIFPYVTRLLLLFYKGTSLFKQTCHFQNIVGFF